MNYEIHNQYPLTLLLLNDWSFITATGIDVVQYLQGKLTADITKLTRQQHILTAHCDANGKILSIIRLFYYKKGFAYILRTSVAAKQLYELTKYAVFSQITIREQHDITLLGVIGQEACNKLSNYFSQLPDLENPIIHLKKTTLLYFNLPYERFLIITDSNTAVTLKKDFPKHGNSQQWLSFDIASGFANIDIENSQKFIPQAVNLQALKSSISFKKGCYSGQEIIARVKYRGLNKRSMFWLTGISNIIPKIGSPIEWKIGNNCWRSIGTILAAVKLTNNFISVQVIMNHDMSIKSTFRIPGVETSNLTIQPLPYDVIS
ncbi:tRNA-modifying protein YgfZ [Arsenophonus endosymbiont of Lipoptena cervi]|uniref:tRNA-modifying protein YgfZ n=1 Tax=Arsenophonus endosymbiont of Lipoptena cervi TaxID=363258 RepID=UPI00376EEB5D